MIRQIAKAVATEQTDSTFRSLVKHQEWFFDPFFLKSGDAHTGISPSSPGSVELTGKWLNDLGKKVPIFGAGKNLIPHPSALPISLTFCPIPPEWKSRFRAKGIQKTYLVLHNISQHQFLRSDVKEGVGCDNSALAGAHFSPSLGPGLFWDCFRLEVHSIT